MLLSAVSRKPAVLFRQNITECIALRSRQLFAAAVAKRKITLSRRAAVGTKAAGQHRAVLRLAALRAAVADIERVGFFAAVHNVKAAVAVFVCGYSVVLIIWLFF